MRLIALALAALLVALPSHAQSLRKINLTQAVASFAFLPISYAKAAGYYAAEGLDVQQIATRGGGPDLVALMSGDVQFNAGAGTYQIGAIKTGRKVLNVYNFYNRNLISVVISTAAQKKSGISPDAPLKERLAALKGLRLGMTRPGALTDKQLRHLGRIGGLKKDDMTIVAIGGPPALLGALERGQIDGFAISPPADQISIARGKAVMWVNNPAGDDPSVDPFMMESILTTEAYAKANPDVVRAMIRATRKAVEDIATKSSADVFKVVQAEFKRVKPDIAVLAIDAVRKALNRKGDVTLKMAENTMRLDGRDLPPAALFATYTAAYQ